MLLVVDAFPIVASVLYGLPSSDVTFDNDIFVPSEILPDCTKSLLLAKFCAGVCSLCEIVVFLILVRSKRSLTWSASSMMLIGSSNSEFLLLLGAVYVGGAMSAVLASAAAADEVLVSAGFPMGVDGTGCCWLLLARGNKDVFRCGGMGCGVFMFGSAGSMTTSSISWC